MTVICHGDDLTTLYLLALPDHIRITAELDAEGALPSAHILEEVRPCESFGGYSYEKLLGIAQTRGQLDADELRV